MNGMQTTGTVHTVKMVNGQAVKVNGYYLPACTAKAKHLLSGTTQEVTCKRCK